MGTVCVQIIDSHELPCSVWYLPPVLCAGYPGVQTLLIKPLKPSVLTCWAPGDLTDSYIHLQTINLFPSHAASGGLGVLRLQFLVLLLEHIALLCVASCPPGWCRVL